MPIQSVLQEYTTDQQTIGASSTGLSLTKIRNGGRWAERVIVNVTTAPIRWQSDGTDPTSTVGRIAYQGETITLDNRGRIQNFRAIRLGSTSSILEESFLA